MWPGHVSDPDFLGVKMLFTAPKRLKLRTSNLTRMFMETFRVQYPLNIFLRKLTRSQKCFPIIITVL